ILYNSKLDDSNSEAKASYKLLQKSNHSTRKLLYNTLSYTNNYCREIALKAILLAYSTSKNKKCVFEDKLKDIVE
ncbi:4802_t:CDS:1, partial [Dentiscutata erythropus]